jgi:hypothetical protein
LIKGVPVKSLEEGLKDLDMIIVSNRTFFAEVEAAVKGKYEHVKLVDITKRLGV